MAVWHHVTYRLQSHRLNQCLLLSNNIENNLERNTNFRQQFSWQEINFENVFCKLAVALSRSAEMAVIEIVDTDSRNGVSQLSFPHWIGWNIYIGQKELIYHINQIFLSDLFVIILSVREILSSINMSLPDPVKISVRQWESYWQWASRIWNGN